MPAWLRRHVDLPTLATDPSSVAAIDDVGTIAWTNEAWRRFAAQNGARPGSVDPGVNYFEAVLGAARDPFLAAVSRARATKGPVEHEYECSSPEQQRFFRMRIVPVGEVGLLIAHHLDREAPHPPGVRLTETAEHVSAEGLVVMCASCRRVARRNHAAWDWIPSWVAQPPARVSHGLCPTCAANYLGEWRRR